MANLDHSKVHVCIHHFCNKQDETDTHVLTCSASDEWRENLYKWYRLQITVHEIDPTLIEVIITALTLHAKGMTL